MGEPYIEIDELRLDVPEKFVCFAIYYDHKVARLELPVKVSGREQASGIESYRQDIQEILSALQEALQHRQGLRWPYHR